jgi:uncharacterized protein (TIGR03435 family)
MKKYLLSLGMFFALVLRVGAQDITGQWQGAIKTPKRTSRIVVKIGKQDGHLRSTLYRIDQPQAPPIDASSTQIQGDVVSILLDPMAAKFEGKLSGDTKSLDGTWIQGAISLPLSLVRATTETAWDIPTPPPPPKFMAPDADPSLEVATIKPNPSGSSSLQQLTLDGRNFHVRNGSVLDLIGFAYDVQVKQVANLPTWGESDRYDIDGLSDTDGIPTSSQLQMMIKKFLIERFGLKVHNEKRDMPAFVLTEAKTGAKVSPTQLHMPLPGLGFSSGSGGIRLNVVNAKVDDFTGFLQMVVLDRPVVNRTDLNGRYDFHVTFAPDDSQFHGHPPNISPALGASSGTAGELAAQPAESAPNLFEALQQQVGLRLNSEKTDVDVVVIDHIGKPSAN